MKSTRCIKRSKKRPSPWQAYKLAVKRNPTPRGATARSMYKILTGSTVP